jgi:hypothetical protein
MSPHSRRDALKYLGAGAAIAAAPFTMHTARASTGALPYQPPLRYFRLADVKLDAGPFLQAQKLNEAYVLRLEPDRMLANFRQNAGLAPRAPV